MRLQRHPRAVGIGLLVDYSVADDARIARHPRNVLQRREIPDRHVIGTFRTHAETPQGKPGKTRAVGEHHLQVLHRYRLGLRGAVDVHELRENVADFVLFEKFLCRLLIHPETAVYLPPHSLTTAPRDSPR